MHIKDPAIPLGSVVVVIGANGFIGLETCEQLLQAGFKVRGTVRDKAKHDKWMHEIFEKKYTGNFELSEVVDFEQDGAFDEAFKGALGVIYVSAPVVFDSDPTKVIDPNVRTTINTLEAAAKAGVRRYVLNSSSKAVETTLLDNRQHTISSKVYNWEALQNVSRGPREESLDWLLNVYSAGRTLAELSFWAWVEKNNPPFVANSVVPDGVFGRGLSGGAATISNAYLQQVLAGDYTNIHVPLAFVIDVEDAARLMVAAVGLSSVSNERILAIHKRYSWNEMRRIARGIKPDVVTGEDEKKEGAYLAEASSSIRRTEEILQDWGRSGFRTEEEMLKSFLDTYY